VLHDAPRARALVAIAAGLWVAWLAIKLWLPQTGRRGGQRVSTALVFTTTMLNPKALIFGLVLLPSPDALGPHLVLFSTLVVAVATGCAGFGAWLGGESGAMLWIRRGASVWLSVVSLTLLAKGLGA
jgi:threonine/homoserine/homoserine lactone efflux protein